MSEETEKKSFESSTTRLRNRVDTITEKINNILEKISELHSDVLVVKEVCKTRGETCAKHVKDLDNIVRGNGRNGMLVRLSKIENRNISKDRFAYLMIGCLATGAVSLIIALVANLIKS